MAMSSERKTGFAVDDLLTVRQLQQLLRVDRITIYRMLDDGRLSGFKVGSQWRFPRQQIEKWLQAQANPPESQEDEAAPKQPASSLPLNCYQLVQEVFAEALDIACVTTNAQGEPEAEIFYHAGESWTLSMFEAANYGIFLNDPVRSKRITERIVREAERLQVQEVVITECGHAYAVSRWEAPKWFKDQPFTFKVRSILEVMDDYIREGRIQLDPSKNNFSATYHDSCNLGRNSGLFDEPRRIMRACLNDFREMTPNRERNYCCGGGGGLVALTEWEETRLLAGKPKAEQIKATGAEAVVASCDNCRHQLGEINTHYELGVRVMGMAELVANAIVPQNKKTDEAT